MQQHLRLDLDGSPPVHPEDDLVEAYTASVVAELDAGDSWFGRALAPQQWRITLRCFPEASQRNPDAAILLPYPPLISVDAVTYLDADGDTQTMVAGTDYEASVDGDPFGFIVPILDGDWPTDVAERWNAITITFTCGYGTGSPIAEVVPETIKQYIRMVAGSMYEQREADVIGVMQSAMHQFRNVINQHRVWGP